MRSRGWLRVHASSVWPDSTSAPRETNVTTPDHAENTGGNVRHAAEVQQRAQENTDGVPEAERRIQTSSPDFNT